MAPIQKVIDQRSRRRDERRPARRVRVARAESHQPRHVCGNGIHCDPAVLL